MKYYNGRVPACGVFCGGCPTFVCDKNPCPGAEVNKARCEKCKTFHLCCLEKGVTHCFDCIIFPCSKFRSFSKRWEKYGQNFVENQKIFKNIGEKKFLEHFNSNFHNEKNVMNIKTTILNNLCYTELVYGRINKKLNAAYSKQEIENLIYDSIDKAGGENCFEKIGKNFYITNYDKNIRITVNSYTYRVITVDKMRG